MSNRWSPRNGLVDDDGHRTLPVRGTADHGRPDEAAVMAAALRVVPLEGRHLDAVAALNDQEVPRVGPLTTGELRRLLRRCALAVVVEEPAGSVAGFALAIAPGAEYDSVNYRWFDARGDDFLYVDRVVVAATHRRQGIGGMLYDAVERCAAERGLTRITCEVNARPSNEGSLAFHAARGFVEVGRQDTSGGMLTVALLSYGLDSADGRRLDGPTGRGPAADGSAESGSP